MNISLSSTFETPTLLTSPENKMPKRSSASLTNITPNSLKSEDSAHAERPPNSRRLRNYMSLKPGDVEDVSKEQETPNGRSEEKGSDSSRTHNTRMRNGISKMKKVVR